MKFTKKTNPEPIPEEGIEQAVKIMRSGHLFRYHFEAEIEEDTIPSILEDELATEVTKLENEFSCYTGHKYVTAVNSCGSALFLSLKAIGLQHQEKVFTNAFTFTAVPSSIVHAGGIPIYVECNHQYLLDVDDFQRKIQANPDAKHLIVSHMRGHISDMETIKALCDENGIFLIEDCAHSLGVKWYDNKHKQYQQVGHHGQIACFSTQSYKLLNSGEGGFVATNDDKIAAYCILGAGSYENLYKKHLSRPFDDQLFEQIKLSVPNFSLRMSNLTAAVLRPQISRLEKKISAYNQRYKQLSHILMTVDNIHLPSPLPQVTSVGDSIQFNLLNLTAKQAEQFIKQTKARGVKIQLFGHKDNARYFKNWQYSFQEMPDLEQTDKIVSFACDLKLSLSFNANDINLMGYIIKEVLYKIVAEDHKVD
ncbi:MAG: aminotransferase class I/II-fold pyridoxal phosphate-dependent enzyme [Pseudomonadota bacterium]